LIEQFPIYVLKRNSQTMTKPVMTIAAEWASFEAAVLRNATPAQRMDMRRAFYSGAGAFHDIMARMMDNCFDNPGEAEVATIDALAEELGMFCIQLAAGAA
jgi:hypothetical protein